MQQILNTASGILFIVAFFPYILAIVRGETKPAKASWTIWASSDTIIFIGMLVTGSLNGQITGATVGAWTILILAMKYGKSGWTKEDIYFLLGGAAGIILWQITSEPTFAIVISNLVILAGAIPTFKNAYKHPEREDKFAWLIFWLSCLAAIPAIPKWDLNNAFQPMTFTVIETVMVYLVWIRPLTIYVEKSSARSSSAE